MRSLALILALLAVPAAAEETVGPWTVSQIDIGCVASTEYSGAGAKPTTLALGTSTEQKPIMIIGNEGWSTEEGKSYEVLLLVDDDLFEGRATGAPGHTLLFILPPRVMNAISKASRLVPALKIDNDHEKLLDSLTLKGSAAAIERTSRCASKMATAAKAAQQRASIIPPDPFKQ